MTIDVAEDDSAFRALVPVGDSGVICCTAGHPDAEEAARHAWKLTTALERKTVQLPDLR